MKPSRRAVNFGLAGLLTTAFMPAKLSAAVSSVAPTSTAAAEIQTSAIITDQALKHLHPSRLLPMLVRNSIDGSDLLLDETLIYDINFINRGAVIAEWQSGGMLRIHEVADLTPDVLQKAIRLGSTMPEEGAMVNVTRNALDLLRSVGYREAASVTGASEETAASSSMETIALPRQMLLRAQQAMQGFAARIGRVRTALLPPRPQQQRALPAPSKQNELAQR